MIKLIIFDFDGTIADTKELYYNSIRKYLKKEGVNISKERFHKELLGIRLKEIIKRVGIKKHARKIKNHVHRDVFDNLNRIKLITGIKDIKEIKVKKIIVSNTITKHIVHVLNKNKIKFFNGIYGSDNFLKKSIFIKKYLKEKNIKKNEAVYIGDTIKDIEVARNAGIKIISISQDISWNSRKELLKNNPDYIISDFKELEDIIKEN
jgi:phosphoglycolate phosphatase-like HAD superfamily hydrolase